MLEMPEFPNETLLDDKEYVAAYMKTVEQGPSSYTGYAEILNAIAIGARVECQASDGTWYYQHPSHTLNEIKGVILGPEKFRVAPAQNADDTTH